MQSNLDHAIELILGSEGGFSNLTEDSGCASCHGCTQATLSAWRKRPVTVDEVMARTEAEASAIYKSQYADKIAFSDLPAGLDYAVLDCAIHSGVAQAAKLLQQALRTLAG